MEKSFHTSEADEGRGTLRLAKLRKEDELSSSGEKDKELCYKKTQRAQVPLSLLPEETNADLLCLTEP